MGRSRAGAALRVVRRSQVNRRPPRREPVSLDPAGGPDPFEALTHGGAGETDDDLTRNAVVATDFYGYNGCANTADDGRPDRGKRLG